METGIVNATGVHAPRGIVLYGIGSVGGMVASLVAARGWRIAAALNRAGDKVGRDLGTLTGVAALAGVPVREENDVDLAALDADIAIVTTTDRVTLNMPVYRRFLSAGLNVLCVGCESSYPWAGTPQLAAEIDQLAKQRGVTFCGSGFQDMHRVWLGLTLIGACSELSAFRHESHTNIAAYGEETARLVRAGKSVAEFAAETAGSDGGEVSIYRVFLEQVTRALGLTVTSVEQSLEPVVSRMDLDCRPLGTTIPAGHCTGTRFATRILTAEGIVATGGNELRLFEPGEEPRIRWSIEGRPPADVTATGFDSVWGTATPLVNRIPQVLDATPGIVTIDRLGPPRFLGNPC